MTSERIDLLQVAVRRVLEAEQATSDETCSALANELLRRLLLARKDPRIAGHVGDEMRRLAGVLTELSTSQQSGLVVPDRGFFNG